MFKPVLLLFFPELFKVFPALSAACARLGSLCTDGIDHGFPGDQYDADSGQDQKDQDSSREFEPVMQKISYTAADDSPSFSTRRTAVVDSGEIVERHIFKIRTDQLADRAEHQKQSACAGQTRGHHGIIFVRSVIQHRSENKNRKKIGGKPGKAEHKTPEKISHRSQYAETGQEQKYHACEQQNNEQIAAHHCVMICSVTGSRCAAGGRGRCPAPCLSSGASGRSGR